MKKRLLFIVFLLNNYLLFSVDLIEIEYPEIPFYINSNKIEKHTIISDNSNFKGNIESAKIVKKYFKKDYLDEIKVVIGFNENKEYKWLDFINLGVLLDIHKQEVKSPVNGSIILQGFDPSLLKNYIVLKIENTDTEIVIGNLDKIIANNKTTVKQDEVIGESAIKQIYLMMRNGKNYYDPIRVLSNDSITYYIAYNNEEYFQEVFYHHSATPLVQSNNYKMTDKKKYEKYLNDLENINIINPIDSDLKQKAFNFGDKIGKEWDDIHFGVDYLTNEGEKVYSATSGIILEKGYNPYRFGNYVVIKSGGYNFIYAHLNRVYIKEGDEVKMGDLLGMVGQTGLNYETSLHFSIMKDGIYINPEMILKK